MENSNKLELIRVIENSRLEDIVPILLGCARGKYTEIKIVPS